MEKLAIFAHDISSQFMGAITEILFFPLDPGRRVYWLFLLSSLLIALFVIYLQQKRFTQRRFSVVESLQQIFAKDVWFSQSTRTDIFLLISNNLLKVIAVIPILGGQLGIAIFVSGSLQRNLGSAPELDLPFWIIVSSYTLVFFVLEDLSRFVLHYLMHKLPWLWKFHKVHHSATALTPLTVYRVHPVEMVLYYGRSILVFGLVTGIFVYLFGRRLSGLDILGVDALGFLFNLFGANLRHSHIWVGFGVFERWFISPAQHQLHHSDAKIHQDINFGTCFAFWDRLFGSWRASGERKHLRFGLSTT